MAVARQSPGEGAVRGLTWLVAGAALVFPPLARSAATWLTCRAAQPAVRLSYLAVFALVLVYAETPLIHVTLDGIAS